VVLERIIQEHLINGRIVEEFAFEPIAKRRKAPVRQQRTANSGKAEAKVVKMLKG
jgi:hypothetical protein